MGSGSGRLLNFLMSSRMLLVGSNLGTAGVGTTFRWSSSSAGGVLARFPVGDERQTTYHTVSRFHEMYEVVLFSYHQVWVEGVAAVADVNVVMMGSVFAA